MGVAVGSVEPQWWDGRTLAPTLDAVLHKGQTMPEKDRFPAVLQPIPLLDVGRRTGKANDNSKAGTGVGEAGDPMFTLQAKGHHAVAVVHGSQDPIIQDNCAFPIGRNQGQENVVVFDPTQITHPANKSNPRPGDPCHTLPAAGYAPTICFTVKDHGQDASEDLAPTMRAMTHGASHANGGGQLGVACVTGSLTHALTTCNNGKGCSEDGTGRGVPIIAAPHAFQPRIARNGRGDMGDLVGALSAEAGTTGKGDSAPCVVDVKMMVRRLMPVEAERLQGFPDGYTLVPTGKRLSADGPRYKQIGNSWAVNVFEWIAYRLDAELRGDLPFESTKDTAAETFNLLEWITAP